MAVPWTPRFGTYHSWQEGDLAFVTVDRAARANSATQARLAQDTHLVCCVVDVPLREPGSNGLPTPTERAELGQVEALITAQLEERYDGWYVGRVTAAGKVSLVYYLANERVADLDLFAADDEVKINREPGLIDFRAGWEPYEISHWAAFDPPWALYAEQLEPNPFQELLVGANLQLHQLTQAGDRTGVARDIDHVARFDDADRARTAAAGLTVAGFTIDDTAEDDDGDTVVAFHRRDTPLPLDVERFIHAIVDAIEPHGGRYDGWTSPIVAVRDAAGVGDLPKRRGLFGRRA
jgi:hypothetical protein